MSVLGIIAEYNPFHNGHLYHLKESIKLTNADYTVCVMSGNFTQRGEPALLDKWIRSRAAVENGIDLVLELPFAFACNNAEYFAKGSVDILNRIGCVTHLSFGSESGNIERLAETANHLAVENDLLKKYIKEYMDKGISYPKARYEAIKEYAGEDCASVIKDANNILAVEYLKQLKITDSNIEPLTIKRYGTGYHDSNFFENIASASAIRDKIVKTHSLQEVKEYLTAETYGVLNEINIDVNTIFNDFFKLISYKILMNSQSQMEEILSATEGLENRAKKAVSKSTDIDSMIKAIKSKRYTATRIQRLLSQILVDLDKDSFKNILDDQINYARVLAFNKKGTSLLKQIKENKLNSIPILTNINRELPEDAMEWKLLNYDIKASDIYNLTTYGEIYRHSDYVMKPFKDFI